METQTQMHGMGLNPLLTLYIDAMLNVDGDIDAKANVKCEHTQWAVWKKCAPSSGVLVITEQFNNVVNEKPVLVNYFLVAEMHVFRNW